MAAAVTTMVEDGGDGEWAARGGRSRRMRIMRMRMRMRMRRVNDGINDK